MKRESGDGMGKKVISRVRPWLSPVIIRAKGRSSVCFQISTVAPDRSALSNNKEPHFDRNSRAGPVTAMHPTHVHV